MNETLMKHKLALLAGLFWLLPTSPVMAQNLGLDRIAVVVNFEAITDLEVKQRVSQALSSLAERGIAAPGAEVVRKQVIEQMIIERAALQLAKEMNMRVDEAAVDRAIEQIARNNQLDRDELLRRASAQGRDIAGFREGLRGELLMQRLREREVDARVQVSEAEVDAVLASLGAAANTEYQLSQILIRLPESASPEQTEKARARMLSLRQQLATGANFAQMAAANSEAPEASAGGDLGWRAAERLPTLFFREIEKLKPGQLSTIIRSAAGFHLLRLNDQRQVSAAAGPPVVQWRARHILFRVSESLPEAEAMSRAEQVVKRLKAGEDFAENAKKFSSDSSAARGGDLGWLLPGDTVPEFERAMSQLEVNQVSEPIRTPFGLHIIQVVEKRTEVAPVERQRAQIRQALRERKAEEAYDGWLQELRDRAYVEYRGDTAN